MRMQFVTRPRTLISCRRQQQQVTNLFLKRFLTASSSDYIEQWQASTVKSNSFYEKHAIDHANKKYFYSIDLQGRVFLEETTPKNIATSIKDLSFLNFLFRNLRKSSPEQDLNLLEENVRLDYPYVSLCGKERNYIRPADAVIVFHSLFQNTENGKYSLGYGGSLSQEFHPSQLAISGHTGRLYHELNGSTTRLHKEIIKRNEKHYGLIKSSISVALSNQMLECSSSESGLRFCVGDNDDSKFYSIPLLPQEYESGVWSMPYVDED